MGIAAPLSHLRVEILCHDERTAEEARACLTLHGVSDANYRLHLQGTDRVWLRDSGANRSLNSLPAMASWP